MSVTSNAALAGAQRGEDADRGVQAADDVDERGADLQRRPVGLAGDVHEPADRLEQQVVAGQVVRRRTRVIEHHTASGLSVAREAEPLHHAGAERLDDDVGAAHELLRERERRRRP